MVERINLAEMAAGELGERYRSAAAAERSLAEELREARTACSSRPSAQSLARLREAQARFPVRPGSWPFAREILRRLNAPMGSWGTARRAMGLTQGELARRAGISRTHYQGIEHRTYEANYAIGIRLWEALGLEVPEGWRDLPI